MIDSNTCLFCKHWHGPRDKVFADLLEYGEISLDRSSGWAPYGGCAESYDWLSIEVWGDAVADAEVPANFGCNRYVAR